ncbi:MAG: histidine phosphatase family protein [Actinomycetota bacterium]
MTESRARPAVALVRHGETEWSKSGRHTGRTDVPLTEAGRAQASVLGEMLAGWRKAYALTSPLQRAAETCRLAGFAHSCEKVDELREWDYGAYEGRTTRAIREEIPGWSIWTHPVVKGESVDEVGERADRVIERLRDEGQDMVVFAHGHLLRILAARWCGLTATHGRFLALDTATFSLLGYERETPVVRMWNAPNRPPAAG